MEPSTYRGFTFMEEMAWGGEWLIFAVDAYGELGPFETYEEAREAIDEELDYW